MDYIVVVAGDVVSCVNHVAIRISIVGETYHIITTGAFDNIVGRRDTQRGKRGGRIDRSGIDTVECDAFAIGKLQHSMAGSITIGIRNRNIQYVDRVATGIREARYIKLIAARVGSIPIVGRCIKAADGIVAIAIGKDDCISIPICRPVHTKVDYVVTCARVHSIRARVRINPIILIRAQNAVIPGPSA